MRRALTAALAITALTLAASVAVAGEETETKQVRRVMVHGGHAGAGDHAALTAKMEDPAQIDGDHLKIVDLDSLLPGESRSYFTEEGREVTVTRGEGEQFTLEVAGKTVKIGGELEEMSELAGGRKVVIEREHDEQSGEGGEEVEKNVVIMRHGPGHEGEPKGRPVVIEIVGEESDERQERRVLVLHVGEEAN